MSASDYSEIVLAADFSSAAIATVFIFAALAVAYVAYKGGILLLSAVSARKAERGYQAWLAVKKQYERDCENNNVY